MSTTAATNFTFNGTTIEFSQAQKDILNADILAINKETSDLNTYINQKADAQGQSDYQSERINHISGNCVGLKHDAYVTCTNDAGNIRAQADNLVSILNGKINASKAKLDEKNPTSLISRYNNDLIQFQNSIKLQIQTQQANQAAANQNTANQATLNQNSAAAVAQAQSLQLQLELAKLKDQEAKSAETKKYLFFGVVVVVVVLAAIIVIRKLL